MLHHRTRSRVVFLRRAAGWLADDQPAAIDRNVTPLQNEDQELLLPHSFVERFFLFPRRTSPLELFLFGLLRIRIECCTRIIWSSCYKTILDE